MKISPLAGFKAKTKMKNSASRANPLNKKYFMSLIFLVLFLATFVSTAEIDAVNRRMALEKNLLSNLNVHHAGVVVKSVPFTHAFDPRAKLNEETKDKAKDYASASKITIKDLFSDIQEYIFTFLDVSELLQTRLVCPHFYNLSSHANHMNLKSYNPDFILKENWMNLALSIFLFKHFEDGRVNADDLLIAEQNILFNVTPADLETKYSTTLCLLSFIHEYENGVNSSLPMSQSYLLVEVINKMVDHEVPKSMEIIDNDLNRFLTSIGRLGEEKRQVLRNYINDTIRLIRSKPDSTVIMTHFRFNPDLSLKTSRLKLLPPFLQIASLNLILPLCSREAQFWEVLEMTSSGIIFPQVLFDQFNEKFPHLVDEIFHGRYSISPVCKRAQHKQHPRDDIIGLNYLLSRNAANPFNIQELLAMNPDITQLISEFLLNNTVTLTEIDLLNQIMEAGLFADIQDEEFLLVKLNKY